MDIKDIKAEIEATVSISALAGTRATRVECPFHLSSDADMALDHARNQWRCYGGCDDGKWHTIYDWVMARDGVDYTTALKSLAEDAGVSFAANRERAQVLSSAQSYYYEHLQKYPDVLAYLHSRGFSDELIFQRQIGYAPEGFFPTNVSLQKLAEVGLMKVSYWKPYPTFSDRIVYPVYDYQYNLVQMQGRLVGKPAEDAERKPPKYLALSNEVDLRGRSIYQCLGGEDILKFDALRGPLPYVFLCEGWPDRETLSSWRINAVCLFGHSGMEKHAARLRRAVQRVYVVLDPDEASQKRLLNGLFDLAIKCPEIEFFVVDLMSFTGGLDLNDWAMRGKPAGQFLSATSDASKIDALRLAMEQAQPLPQALIDKWGSYPHLIELIARYIAVLPNPEPWIKALATAVGQSPSAVAFLISVLIPKQER